MTLFFFALALIVVFVPIYLYQLGYGLPEIAGYYYVRQGGAPSDNPAGRQIV